MSISVAAIYEQACDLLLEPGGLQLGVVSTSQFLSYAKDVIVDFAQRTGIWRSFWLMDAQFAIPEYEPPAAMTEVRAVFYRGRYLAREDSFILDNLRPEWATETGPPERWSNARTGVSTFRIHPAPVENLEAGNQVLRLYGEGNPLYGVTLALDSTVEHIPKLFEHHIRYGILEKVFSSDGEAKDLMRAKLCRNRYLEGINAAKAIMGETVYQE